MLLVHIFIGERNNFNGRQKQSIDRVENFQLNLLSHDDGQNKIILKLVGSDSFNGKSFLFLMHLNLQEGLSSKTSYNPY